MSFCLFLIYILAASVYGLTEGNTFSINEKEIKSETFKFKNSDIENMNKDDSSAFSSDGPIVIYDESGIINYSVIPFENKFEVSIKQISKYDTLSCYTDETDERFSFILKDKIDTEKDTYELPEKMLIISDIEGNFKGFKSILTGAGVINNKLNWDFGNGHLVLAGDFFDRGINVTECLWLIYKLESEAESAGGKVHLILGNHEMMNLKSDFRYVRKKYIDNADSLKLEYGNWYSQNTELGKWLRSKNSVEKIGNFLILHAGISSKLSAMELSLNEINDSIRNCIDKFFEKGEMKNDLFIGSDGPLWYRGIIQEKESQEEVENTLSKYNAEKMITGHTIVDEIKYLYKGKVIAIDLDHQENSDKGFMNALWYENNEFYKIDNTGSKSPLK